MHAVDKTKLLEIVAAVALGVFVTWTSIYTIGFSAALAIPQWLTGPMESMGSTLSIFLWNLLLVYPLGVGLLILLVLWGASRFPIRNSQLFCLVFALTLCSIHLISSFWSGAGYSPLLVLTWSTSYCVVAIVMVWLGYSLSQSGHR